MCRLQISPLAELNLPDNTLARLAHSQFSKARTDDRTHRGLKKLIQKAARLCIDFLKPPRGRRRDGAKNENLDSKEREPESETQQMTENVEKTRRRLAREARRHAWRGRGVSVSTGGGGGVVKGKRGRVRLSAAEDENGWSVAWTKRRQREMGDVREARQSALV